MNVKDIKRIADKIQRDAELGFGEKILICVDRKQESMLNDACLLIAEGGIREVFWETSSDGIQADEAVIRMSEDGADLVAFHESRPSSKDHRPNGIRVHHEELDFPCIVFYNSGAERLTVDGKWLAPGEYTAIQEADANSPEVRKFLDQYIKSPEVMEGIEEARRAYAEKTEQRSGRNGQ